MNGTNMADLTSRKVIITKGFLFLAASGLCALGLFLESPTLKTALLAVGVAWCFARFYYFAFYVIQHYVDPGYRFSGLWSLAVYLLGRRNQSR
jgi:hypothetical protein